MIICEKCSGASAVVSGFAEERTKARRRKCLSCGYRWSTIEVIRPSKSLWHDKSKIDAILAVYATRGSVAARALAESLNVSPNQVKNIAYRCGVKAKRKEKPPKRIDPRWERAVQIGAVEV